MFDENNFVTSEIIGQGSFGLTKKAIQVSTGQNVAIKLIEFTNEDTKIKMNQEIATLQKLSHPNIVQYLGYYMKRNKLAIVMELVEGGDAQALYKTMRQKQQPLELNNVWEFIFQMAYALSYIHSQGIIHKDFKPANILLSGDKKIYKLADFGLAKHLIPGQNTVTQTQLGTPLYDCPELFETKRSSTQADLFSFGVVIFNLIELDHPFTPDLAPIYAQRVVTEQPKPFRLSKDETLNNLVIRMLDKV
ncbi:MAG: putative NEK protein kinase [Streblomastix strix]|uniref:Putative NEK protein kinase n=1 Tax=Streblomastix strix TaxID=222440 RepID=A0A5J4WKJ0_9EUKA|nr:MAG: putative NEK protein kinase [Streblomastix strix]